MPSTFYIDPVNGNEAAQTTISNSIDGAYGGYCAYIDGSATVDFEAVA